MDDRVTFLDHWRVVWRARVWIAVLVLLTVAVAVVVARMLPKVYVAGATALPPRPSASQTMSTSLSAIGALAGQLGGGSGFSVPGVSVAIPSATPAQDLFIAVLKSRTMRETVVGELAKTWGPSVGARIVAVQPALTDKLLLSLSVEATDAKLAADAANLFLQRLDLLLEEHARRALQHQQAMFTDQLETAAKEVQSAENALLKFQTENHVLASSMLRAAGAGAGQAPSGDGSSLRGVIMGLELQREVLRMRYTDEHPQVRELDKQIAELKRQYSQNLFGSAMELPPERPGMRGARKEFFTPAEKTTTVQLEMQKLLRNLQIQEGFFTAALQGLQQIKYGDVAAGIRVEVLDRAVPASTHIRPNMVVIISAAVIGALVTGIFFALILEYIRQTREVERRRRDHHQPLTTSNGDPNRARAGRAVPDEPVMHPSAADA